MRAASVSSTRQLTLLGKGRTFAFLSPGTTTGRFPSIAILSPGRQLPRVMRPIAESHLYCGPLLRYFVTRLLPAQYDLLEARNRDSYTLVAADA